MKALSLAVSSDIRTLPAIRPASLCGMWAVLLTVSILYCWLYEFAHGHPVGELVPTIRWSFQAWVGWMTLSVLWFMSWRSGNQLEKLWQHRKGWIPILIATPFFAVLIEWYVHLVFSSVGWQSYRSGNYWVLLYDRAPWALVASSTLAVLSYLSSRRAVSTQRVPYTPRVTACDSDLTQASVRSGNGAPASCSPAGGRANGLIAQMSRPAVESARLATHAANAGGIERLRAAPAPSVPALRITTPAGPMDVPATAIEALIAAENYVDVCLSDGKHYLHRATLQSVGDALQSASLVRVRRSAIVNLDHVHGRLSDWRLRLSSGRIVRVGRTYRAQFEACRPRINGAPPQSSAAARE